MKTCTKCDQEKVISEFGKDAQKRDGLRSVCKQCNREVAKVWELRTKEKRVEQSKKWKTANQGHINEASRQWRRSESGAVSNMLTAAKRRAKQSGVPFSLTAADIQIPEFCPVFGKRLVHNAKKGPSPWSPSLDKIIPALGYVPGNVRVSSHKANLMKNDATPEELLAFANWIQKNQPAISHVTTLTGDLA